tara:strand:+ start:958 stop:1494 length:537 start_codon:yes stop_codon:yes gene_type:complete
MYDLSKVNKKNICIMGLMGSGKTVIGKELSKYLNLKFFDTDKEIEIKTKKSISAIFEQNGEAYFRSIEEKICLKLLANYNCVISLGGGSVINNKIRKAIKRNSYSIYLHVKINNLANRLISSKKRPLLNKTQNKLKILKNLYDDRRKFYESANFIVDNNNDKFQVLEKIKSELSYYAK